MNDHEPASAPPAPDLPADAPASPAPLTAAKPLSIGFAGEVTARTWSGLGVSSIALSLVAGAGLFFAIGYMAYRQITTGVDASGDTGLMMVLGLAMMLCAALLLVGTALGAAGLFQRGRKRLLPALGLIFNAALLAILITLFAVGVSAS